MATIPTPNRRAAPTPGDAIVTRFPQAAVAVTKSDVDVFAGPVNVRSGSAGVLNVVPEGSRAAVEAGTDPLTLGVAVPVLASDLVPFDVCMVLSTSTTATGIIAVW